MDMILGRQWEKAIPKKQRQEVELARREAEDTHPCSSLLLGSQL